MKKPANLSGHRFGRLIALSFVFTRNSNAHWACRCDCGGEAIVAACHLKSRHTTSCGCLHPQVTSAQKRRHGESVFADNTKEYRCWSQMKQRCFNPKHNRFHRYGGRGIKVCDRWLHSYEDFLADMGRAPSARHSIDRMDNDGNYEPTNCRWATSSQQAYNRTQPARAAA